MEINYKNNKLKKQLGSASEIKKAYGQHAKKLVARLSEMEAAPNLGVLMQLPAANCHPLTGNRNGEWAVSISSNHRLIFEIANNSIPLKEDGSIDTVLVVAILLTGTEDYH